MKKAFPIVVSFAVGLAAGVWWTKLVPGRGEDTASAVPCADVEGGRLDAKSSPRQDKGGFVQSECGKDTASTEEEVAAPPPTVEVVVDDSPASEPEMISAHAARQVRRRLAREAKERERHDFLSVLNPDLLTAEQRRTHALYIEANETRTAARKEISSLRAAGKEVPAKLQTQLADAESVLRSDREAEQRLLREAAARAAGLDEPEVRRLLEDLQAIDGAFR